MKVLLALVMLGLSAKAQTTPASSQTPTESLTVLQAKELLRSRSPIFLRERQNLALAQAGITEARQIPNPDIEVISESYPLYEDRPGSFFNNQELTFRAGQTIETAGKRRKRTAVARRAFDVSKLSIDDTLRLLTVELQRRYFQAALAKTQLAVSRDVLKQFDEILRVNQERYKQGEVSGLDFARLQTERMRFANDVIDNELQLRNSKAAVIELLGLDTLPDNLELTDELDIVSPRLNFEDALATSIASRPDLAAQEARREQFRLDLDLQKAQRIPNVTPSAGYKRDFGLNTSYFSVSVPLPLFNRNQAGVQRATAQISQQEYELSRTRFAVRRDVTEAFNALMAQDARVAAMKQTYVPSATKARDIARESYKLGAIDLIVLLDAERTYRETLRTFNQTLFERRVALAQLEAAIGKELAK